MSKVLVTYVSRYDFPDPKTGKQIKGAKIHYIIPGMPVSRPADQKGILTIELGMPYESFNDEMFPKVPGIYELNTAQVPASGGKLAVVFDGIKFLKEYKISLE